MKTSMYLHRLLLSIYIVLAVAVYSPSSGRAVVPRESADKPAPENSGSGFADYPVGVFFVESGSPQAAV